MHRRDPQPSTSSGPAADDRRLHAILRSWHVAEASPGFDAAVWDAIRTGAATDTARRLPLAARLLLSPAWLGAAAASVALAVGALAGSSLGLRAQPARSPLLQPWTLTGTYVSLAAGGGR